MATITALNGPSNGPANGQSATAAVILLHGYGASGEDLIGLAPYFAQSLPHAVFYSPNAPHAWEGGGFGGRQWFGLQGYDPDGMRRDPNRFAAVYQAMFEGAVAAADVLNRYIDEVMAAHGLAASRVALLGFSQGTMMSLHVGLRRTESLAAILGYSGSLVGASLLAGEIKSKPPVCLIHGDADPVVPVAALRAAATAIEPLGVPLEQHVIRGVQHGIDPIGAELGAKFLTKHLG
jgi:phospholipase/carboxylesterase